MCQALVGNEAARLGNSLWRREVWEMHGGRERDTEREGGRWAPSAARQEREGGRSLMTAWNTPDDDVTAARYTYK